MKVDIELDLSPVLESRLRPIVLGSEAFVENVLAVVVASGDRVPGSSNTSLMVMTYFVTLRRKGNSFVEL